MEETLEVTRMTREELYQAIYKIIEDAMFDCTLMLDGQDKEENWASKTRMHDNVRKLIFPEEFS